MQKSSFKISILRLDRPQLLSVDRLNRLLKGKGMLENQGQAFANAAKLTGVNEIYLIAHALLETGNGQSKLAKGANLVNNQVVSNSLLNIIMYMVLELMIMHHL